MPSSFEQTSYREYLTACPPSDIESQKPDLDFYQVSISLIAPSSPVLVLLIELCGEMVTLSSKSKPRSGAAANIPLSHLILTYHPIIISTINSAGLKGRLIARFLKEGFPSFADSTDRTMVRNTRPVPVRTFLKVLWKCRVAGLCLTNYGMKTIVDYSPLHSWNMILLSHAPPADYPPNTYDISFSCYLPTLFTIRLRDAPDLKRYVLFSPLDQRPLPLRYNIGGSYKRVLNDSPDPATDCVLSCSTYSPLHHHVLQATGKGTLTRPNSIRTGQERLKTYQELISDFLETPFDRLGGLRHECRVQAVTPWLAWQQVRLEEPWEIANYVPEFFCMTVEDYLVALPQVLDRAADELHSLGFSLSHRPLPPGRTTTCTDAQKKIFGDLRRLFGETVYPGQCVTDPIDRDAWWRRRFTPNEANYVPLPPIILPPVPELENRPAVIPPTSDDEFRGILTSAITNSYRRRRVNWVQVAMLVAQVYPGLTKEQIMNRGKWIKRTGVFDWTNL